MSRRQRFPVIAPSGEEVNKAATGSGSVEAIFNTLEELVEW